MWGEHKMTSPARKKFNIFFDTNVLETRYGSGLLQFGEFRLSGECSKIQEFIKKNNLKNDVELCIPDVVWREIIQHMRENFFSQKQSVQSLIENYIKSFGDLAEINCEFKINNNTEYEEYLKKIEKDFWTGEGKECKLIPYPKSKGVVDKLINKAFKKERPFVETKAIKGGKIYSDAGLKDALIIETMSDFCNKDTIGILYSNDADFRSMFTGDLKDKFQVFNTFDAIINYLEIENKLNKKKLVRLAFENGDYLKETVVDSSGNNYDKSVTKFVVKNVSSSDEADIFIVNISATINEAKYLYEIKYDFTANEVVDSSYTIENE